MPLAKSAVGFRGYPQRRAGALRFAGVRSDDLPEILGALAQDAAPVFSDLSLGAWRLHQVASEFAEQLGAVLPALQEAGVTRPARGQRPLSSTAIDQWVDVEARGNLGCTYALDAATAIVERVLTEGPPRSFIVVLPKLGQGLGLANCYFLEFLQQALQHTGSSLLLAASPECAPCLPAHWEVDWRRASASGSAWPRTPLNERWLDVPGLLPKAAVEVAPRGGFEAWAVGDDFLLVPPALRETRQGSLRPGPPLNATQGAPPWALRCLYTLRIAGAKKPSLSELEEVAEAAWVCIENGDSELGLRLGVLGRDIAQHPVSTAHMAITLQALRLRANRYDDVAEDEEGPRGLSSEFRDQWFRGKAYAAALTGRVALARECFQRSSAFSASEPEEWTDLYARNLVALVYAREGDWQRARALQASIEAELAERGDGESHLRYINAINTARLYRQRQDFSKAAEFYRRAFAVTNGVRTENDLLYGNLCWAKLNDACNQPRAALIYWLRAALHWAAARVPEALGYRCAAILLQRPVGADERTACEFSARLRLELLRAAEAALAAPLIIHEGERVPTFFYTGAPGLSAESRELVSVAGAGWCLFLHPEPVPPAYSSLEHEAVRRAVWALIRREVALPNAFSSGAVQLDHQFNREIPESPAEALDTAVRLRARRRLGQGVDSELTEAACLEHEAKSKVCLGPAVLRIEQRARGAQVVFRRQWPALELDLESSEVLERTLAGARALRELEPTELARLRYLERQRVVVLRADASAPSEPLIR